MTTNLEFPLADLTTTLVRDVFRSITDSAMEQAEAYADLAAEVGMPLEAYQEKILGLTEAEKQATVETYIRTVVLPLLVLPTAEIPDPLYFAEARREPFLAHFHRVVATDVSGAPRLVSELVEPSQSAVFPWFVQKANLLSLVTAKIRRDASLTHARVTALLRAGLPNIVVTGGQICTKVTMTITQSEVSSPSPTPGSTALSPKPASSLGVRVRVANERSIAASKSMELVGSVRIDFRAGTFPPLAPASTK
ncbi:hypothetical protein [Polyangium fumosum]|uniref:Uncharacterized protein n=1 Tax=Polyangium fumosum TaxID=889272 RepID=A0A4U1J289_9BACT|nr:hypothetical protein [Polyangium fumosum]TKD01183.1 hypothetical protein E8A74_31785 [Polyangium fumosum]